MQTIDDILLERAQVLSETYLSAVRSRNPKSAQVVPAEEIMHLAAKLKRLHLDRTGITKTIGDEASAHYEEHLKRTDLTLYSAYLQSKQPDITKELKAALFSQLARVCPDTPIKLRYIQDKLSLDPERDYAFIIQAAQQVAYQRAKEEIDNLKLLFTRVATRPAFDSFLNLVQYMDAVSVATLFRRELLHMLADGYAGHELRALFYKCLRLTHERGRVSFYSELDDHIGFDRDGNSITFVGNAELYQLDTIANIARGITRFGITPRNVLVVCDFDLHKFAGYEIPRPQLMAYVTNVKEYLRDVDVDVVLQTEYFHSDTFHVTFADVLRSIMRRDGRFIHRTEFERIEQDYFRHYSKSMEGWNAARNEYYSIRSVARNVAEGLELSNGNAIVYVFNESLVNGERFSLKAANKVPFVGLRKVKLKKDPLANAL